MQKRDAISEHPPLQSFRADRATPSSAAPRTDRARAGHGIVRRLTEPEHRLCPGVARDTHDDVRSLVNRFCETRNTAFRRSATEQASRRARTFCRIGIACRATRSIVDLLTTVAGKGLRIRGPRSSTAYIAFIDCVYSIPRERAKTVLAAPSQMIPLRDRLPPSRHARSA